MNIVDIGVVVFIIFGGILGFSRGFTKSLVEAIGTILVVVLAYLFKNPVSVFFYEHLPFFNLNALKGSEVLNILLYEVLAFLAVLAVLVVILRMLLMATSVFERILNATVILGLPSKIAGAIIGLLQHYVLSFVILYILTLGFVTSEIVAESELRPGIVEDTPILSEFVSDSTVVVDKFRSLINKYDDKKISESDFNRLAIQLFMEYKLITPESVEKLIEKGKISEFDNYKIIIENAKNGIYE